MFGVVLVVSTLLVPAIAAEEVARTKACNASVEYRVAPDRADAVDTVLTSNAAVRGLQLELRTTQRGPAVTGCTSLLSGFDCSFSTDDDGDKLTIVFVSLSGQEIQPAKGLRILRLAVEGFENTGKTTLELNTVDLVASDAQNRSCGTRAARAQFLVSQEGLVP